VGKAQSRRADRDLIKMKREDTNLSGAAGRVFKIVKSEVISWNLNFREPNSEKPALRVRLEGGEKRRTPTGRVKALVSRPEDCSGLVICEGALKGMAAL